MLGFNNKAKQYCLALFCLVSCLVGLPSMAHAAKVIDNWKLIQDSFYAGQTIPLANGEVTLQAPSQAEDASLVPLTIAVQLTSSTIQRMDLFVDANPIPLTLTVLPQMRLAQMTLSTRIRLDNNSMVRVVLEDATGIKRMQTTQIKTPGGGCGGGLSGDEAKLRAEAGKMKFKLSSPNTMTFHIKHPMRTGFERTTQGYYAKAWYMKQLRLHIDQRSWLSAELGPGISADPYFLFEINDMPASAKSLLVEAEDNEGATFSQSFDWTFITP